MVNYMKAKDISLIVLGVAFIGGLSVLEAMAGLYPNRVIYTIPAQKLPDQKCSEYYREILITKRLDETLEKQCWEYVKKKGEYVRESYGQQ